MERGYDHADEKVWSMPRLENRYNQLAELETANYLSEARKEQVRHEMACVAFEGIMRQTEINKEKVLFGQLRFNYE